MVAPTSRAISRTATAPYIRSHLPKNADPADGAEPHLAGPCALHSRGQCECDAVRHLRPASGPQRAPDERRHHEPQSAVDAVGHRPTGSRCPRPSRQRISPFDTIRTDMNDLPRYWVEHGGGQCRRGKKRAGRQLVFRLRPNAIQSRAIPTKARISGSGTLRGVPLK
jgi:hypothetical protein